jgi:hypothetical protein
MRLQLASVVHFSVTDRLMLQPLVSHQQQDNELMRLRSLSRPSGDVRTTAIMIISVSHQHHDVLTSTETGIQDTPQLFPII